MNLSKVKKTDLYDYVETKILAQNRLVNEEIHEVIESVKKNIRENLKDVEFIPQKASALEEKIDKAIQSNVHYTNNSWGIRQYHRHATELISFVDKLVNENYNSVVRDYLNHQSNVATMEKWYPEVKKFIDPLIESYDRKLERRTKIEKLARELKAVIKSSTSGANAYKALDNLGVDMTDFKVTESYVPAVQKLSVDVCLVNGGC